MPIIRKMNANDKEKIIDMMRGFYASEAVLTNGSEEIFSADVDECVSSSPYAEGYVIEDEGEIIGYSMVAKSYSTEFGRRCVWIEDLFIKEGHRGEGLGTKMIKHVESLYPGALIRLEAEAENERAIRVYKKCGFEEMPYMELKKFSGEK